MLLNYPSTKASSAAFNLEISDATNYDIGKKGLNHKCFIVKTPKVMRVKFHLL